jgi:phosphate transport system substrate-binding protein
MKRFFLPLLLLIALVFSVSFFSCNDKKQNENKETILTGKASILVDETVKAIIEDQVQVFENQYDAQITMISKSEKECLNDFMARKENIIILTRNLTDSENKLFLSKKINPTATAFAKDGIALIVNAKITDSLIDFNEILRFAKGENVAGIKGLVFDNPNSSTVRYICEKASINTLPQQGVFSFETNDEVIKYVGDNSGMIGVVGVNSLFQPSVEMIPFVNNIKTLKVKSNTGIYYAPTQETIAEGVYPLARVLYIINTQGYSGLGMGFSSFIAGDIGQRIVLKSGLSPIRMPNHDIRVRKELIKDKN